MPKPLRAILGFPFGPIPTAEGDATVAYPLWVTMMTPWEWVVLTVQSVAISCGLMAWAVLIALAITR